MYAALKTDPGTIDTRPGVEKVHTGKWVRNQPIYLGVITLEAKWDIILFYKM
jgi:hypothetical protein